MEDRNERYQRALKQVQEQRNWYTHLAVYLVVNTIVQLFYSGFFFSADFVQHMPWWARFTMPVFWGISLIIHYFYSFRPSLWRNNFFKRWEQKKIEEYMRKDEEEFNVRFRENVKE